jgi:hypothetical protein
MKLLVDQPQWMPDSSSLGAAMGGHAPISAVRYIAVIGSKRVA